MPQVNNPNAIAASVGGMMKELQAQIDDIKGQNVDAATLALVALQSKQIADQNKVIALLGSLSATNSYSNSGIALGTGSQYFTLTVPAGMTKLSYTVFASGSGRNATGSTDFLLINVTGPGGGSGFASASVATGSTIYVSTGAVGTSTGLTAGQVMSFNVSLTVGTAWAANGANTLNAQVLGVFQP